jgi:hypothetical protein
MIYFRNEKMNSKLKAKKRQKSVEMLAANKSVNAQLSKKIRLIYDDKFIKEMLR